MVCYHRTIFENLESEGAKKIIFKVVQIKFLAMLITNQKLSFDIFMVGISSCNMIFNILMIFVIDECGEWGGSESRGNGARPVE